MSSNDNMSSNGIFLWEEVDKHIPPKRQLLWWTMTIESASNTISSKILGANKAVKIVWYIFFLGHCIILIGVEMIGVNNGDHTSPHILVNSSSFYFNLIV